MEKVCALTCEPAVAGNLDQDVIAQFDPLISGSESELHMETRTAAGSVLDLEFDNSAIIELFEDEYSCPVCFEVFCSVPPRHVVDCSFCRKSFCERCLVQASANGTKEVCPFCRQNFDLKSLKRNFEKEKSVAHLPSNCIVCNKQMARGDLEVHEALCEDLHNHQDKTLPPDIAPETARTTECNTWSCSRCTFLNHPDISTCEMCEGPRAFQSNVMAERSQSVPHERVPPPPTSPQSAYSLDAQMDSQQGVIYVQVQTKLLFKKWKPVMYILTKDHLQLFPLDSSYASSTSAPLEPLKVIKVHRYMRFGKIYTLSDAKVTIKNSEAQRKNRIMRRTSFHQSLYAARLFENPPSVLKKEPSIERAGRFLPKPGNYQAVVHVAMEDDRELKVFMRKLSRFIADR